ncbi:MAG: hypothetical protein ABSC23_04980 [Bryobacteraceae bacterium]|jgi:hypothetical protein
MGVVDPNAFTHALYHMVSHWAAVVAVIGLLSTFGIILSTTRVRPAFWGRAFCVANIVLLWVISWYFLYRMTIFRKWLDNALPANYNTVTGATPYTHALGFLVLTVLVYRFQSNIAIQPIVV